MPKPQDDIAELPEGQDMFDRKYVENLRAEAAKYRTERNKFAEAFDGLNEEETDWMLDKIGVIASDPENGAVELLDIATGFLGEDRVLEILEIEIEPGEEEEEVEEEDDVDSVEAMRKLLEERDQAAAKAAEDAQLEADREAIYQEIEALGPEFERGSDAFDTALALGKVEAGKGREVNFTELAPRIAAAAGVEFTPPAEGDQPAGDSEGAPEGAPRHPVTAGAGGSGAATENQKDWVAETKESGGSLWDAARERMESRLDNGSN